MKDHLSYKNTFCGPMGGLKAQVSLYMHILTFLHLKERLVFMLHHFYDQDYPCMPYLKILS